MAGRIKFVQTMGQHAYGLIAVGQGLPMRMDIHAIGQATHDKHLWAKFLQFPDEAGDNLLPIDRAMASAHDINDPQLVEVGVSLVEQHQWGIVHISQTVGIVLVVQRQRRDAILHVVFEFHFRPFQRLVSILQRGHQSVCGIRQYVPDVMPMLHHGGGGA